MFNVFVYVARDGEFEGWSRCRELESCKNRVCMGTSKFLFSLFTVQTVLLYAYRMSRLATSGTIHTVIGLMSCTVHRVVGYIIS